VTNILDIGKKIMVSIHKILPFSRDSARSIVLFCKVWITAPSEKSIPSFFSRKKRVKMKNSSFAYLFIESFVL